MISNVYLKIKCKNDNKHAADKPEIRVLDGYIGDV